VDTPAHGLQKLPPATEPQLGDRIETWEDNEVGVPEATLMHRVSCRTCDGDGVLMAKACPACKGQGWVDTYDVAGTFWHMLYGWGAVSLGMIGLALLIGGVLLGHRDGMDWSISVGVGVGVLAIIASGVMFSRISYGPTGEETSR
jgi:hypothetical protein